MIYLQFTAYGACALNEDGQVLWQAGMPIKTQHHEARPESYEWWSKPSDAQVRHRGIIEFSGEIVREFIEKETKLAFPDGTRFYDLLLEWMADRVWIKVMHPDLYEIEEGRAVPFTAPVFEDGPDGKPQFVSWGMNADH